MTLHYVADTTARRLQYRLATLQSRGRIPSVVNGVVRSGGLVFSDARGSFSPGTDPLDTQYRIGSITKTFVAVAVMQLRDEGCLALNDPIDVHLPHTPFGEATIAQLLSHTAGVSAELPGSWWERSPGLGTAQFHEAIAQDTVIGRHGWRHHYSNLGFAILGELVSKLRRQEWDAAIRAHILQPLEMGRTTTNPAGAHATGYAVHPFADVTLPEAVQDTKAMAPAGQLWSTVTDLARWALFIGGDTAGVLSRDTIEEMREPVSLNDNRQWSAAAGLGVQLWRRPRRFLVGHGGSMPGFQASLNVDPRTSTGVITVMNCTNGADVDNLEDPFDIMDECEPVFPEVWRPADSVPHRLLALTGSWFFGVSEAVLRVEADGWLRLQAVSGLASSSRFRPNDDGSWTGLDGYYRGEVLRVVGDLDGEPHLDVGTFVFTRRPYEPSGPIPGGMANGHWPVS